MQPEIVQHAAEKFRKSRSKEDYEALLLAIQSVQPTKTPAQSAMQGLLSRIDAQHKAEIERLRKAVGEVPDFQGTLGKLGP